MFEGSNFEPMADKVSWTVCFEQSFIRFLDNVETYGENYTHSAIHHREELEEIRRLKGLGAITMLTDFIQNEGLPTAVYASIVDGLEELQDLKCAKNLQLFSRHFQV